MYRNNKSRAKNDVLPTVELQCHVILPRVSASRTGIMLHGNSLSALPLPNLLRSTLVLHACGSDTLVRAASVLLTRNFSPVLAAAKPTVFRHFAAGESIDDVRAVATRLSASGVSCIVDHATEEIEADGERAGNVDSKRSLLQTLSSELGGTCRFMPVKMTGLVAPTLLERLTDGVRRVESRTETRPSSSSETCVAVSAVVELPEAAAAAALSDAEQTELTTAVERMRSLCDGASSSGVSLLLDAEQWHRQPAIRLLARTLAAEFNATPGKPPLVYDTHQAYLRGCEGRLRADLAHAKAHGYTLAVKLVRGAYTQGERARDASVLQPDKPATDAAYDACASMLLQAATATHETEGAAARSTPASAALLLATHNRASARVVAEAMAAAGTPADHPRVHFAQILGMADDLTFSLGLGGFNACKLVPFGDFGEVLPWLLRRLEENRDALGAAAEERPLLRRELARRVTDALALRWGT